MQERLQVLIILINKYIHRVVINTVLVYVFECLKLPIILLRFWTCFQLEIFGSVCLVCFDLVLPFF